MLRWHVCTWTRTILVISLIVSKLYLLILWYLRSHWNENFVILMKFSSLSAIPVRPVMKLSSKWRHFHFHALTAVLTHWGRVTHICVSKLTIVGSNNGLSPGRRQVIIWTTAEILLIGVHGNSEISIDIQTFSFKKMHLKMSSGNWWPLCLGLNVLIQV